MELVKTGICESGWCLYQTDKSGKMCLETVQNYIQCMNDHVKDDEVVTPDRVREAEVVLNNHARTWVRMMAIGSGVNQQWRVNRAMVSKFAPIPPMMGLRKDHKGNINNDETLGLKLRHLCLANKAPNAPLRNLQAKIAAGLADEMQESVCTEVIST